MQLIYINPIYWYISFLIPIRVAIFESSIFNYLKNQNYVHNAKKSKSRS